MTNSKKKSEEIFGKEALEVFPHAGAKLIIDVCNSINKVDDLNQGMPKELIERLCDSTSGRAQQRQQNINEQLNKAISNLQALLNELFNNEQQNATAISNVIEAVKKNQQHIGDLADYSQETRQALKALREYSIEKFFQIEERLISTEKRISINEQLDFQLSQWDKDELKPFSPAEKCFIVVDRFYWNTFHAQRNKELSETVLRTLENKISTLLKTDLGADSENQPIHVSTWFNLDSCHGSEIQEILQFQADWCLASPRLYPTTFWATQWRFLPKNNALREKVGVHNFLDIKRVAKRMIDERFKPELKHHPLLANP